MKRAFVARLNTGGNIRGVSTCIILHHRCSSVLRSVSTFPEVRVRFAPSPTGAMHLGGLRTALYNFLFAKQNKGTFILRLEDTDQTREVPGSLANFTRILEWANIPYDEGPGRGDYGPYIQSQRKLLYKQRADELIAKGAAYRCFCTSERLEKLKKQDSTEGVIPMYDKFCRGISPTESEARASQGIPHTIRLKVPNGYTKFRDIVRGKLSFNNALVSDQILLKSDGFPTYHLACVVDDHLMKISHVIRGEEWLTSTPKHVILYQAFGWPCPEFAHLPLLLNPDRTKLSKRQGDASVDSYIDQKYLPEALVNFAAFLGWSPQGTKELFSLDELIAEFRLDRVHKAGAIVNRAKLDWFNSQHFRLKCDHDTNSIMAKLKPLLRTEMTDEYITKLIHLLKYRATCVEDFVSGIDMIFTPPDYSSPEGQLAKTKLWDSSSGELVNSFESRFALEVSCSSSSVNNIVKELCESRGLPLKALFHPLRFLLSGTAEGPGVPDLIDVLGKEETLRRLKTGQSFALQ